MPWLFEEVAREKGAIGDWLEARIADLDARIAAVEAGGSDPGPSNEVSWLHACLCVCKSVRMPVCGACMALALTCLVSLWDLQLVVHAWRFCGCGLVGVCTHRQCNDPEGSCAAGRW